MGGDGTVPIPCDEPSSRNEHLFAKDLMGNMAFFEEAHGWLMALCRSHGVNPHFDMNTGLQSTRKGNMFFVLMPMGGRWHCADPMGQILI